MRKNNTDISDLASHSPKYSVFGGAVWNFTGQIIPIAIALVCVPLLIHRIGVERFGLLSLAWVLIGYAGVFDFGIARAMTRVVSEALAANKANDAIAIGRVVSRCLLLLGVGIGLLLIALSYPIVNYGLSNVKSIRDEATLAVGILALSLPFVLQTTAYRGLLEAYGQFRKLNLVRSGMGVLNYLGPLAAALISPTLPSVVGAVVLMRIVANFAHRNLAHPYYRLQTNDHGLEWWRLRPLLSIGGWITVSNVVSPLMSYLDRFLVAGMVSVAAVAYYSTPYDLVNRLQMFPSALIGVLFPLFASMQAQPQRIPAYLERSVRLLTLALFPVVACVVLFAREGFELWLGRDFAQQSAPIMAILVVGWMFNAVAQLPATLIQAAGQPKSLALLNLAELPVYLGALVLATNHFGIVGTAGVWALRNAIDAGMVASIASKMFKVNNQLAKWFSIQLLFTSSLGGLAYVYWDLILVRAVLVLLTCCTILFLLYRDKLLNEYIVKLKTRLNTSAC